MSYSYLCKKCGKYHHAKTIFYHLIEKRRMKKNEVNEIGLDGFGKTYAFARYCAKTKEYTIIKGFVGY